jgi:opacity protein-like surface antigen
VVRVKEQATDNETSTITNGVATATEASTEVYETRNRWDATLSLRVGYAVDRLLFFGKAGAVVGAFNFSNNSSSITTCGGPVGCGSSSFSENGSKDLIGMLIGFGFEYAFLDNWIFRLEGDYLNFPRTDVPSTFSNSCCGGPGTTVQTGSGTFSQFASKGLLKAGVSFKFP